ncbi:sensor histidine kinase [Maritimibacter sp. DP1N21-5]|uniref:sensor histidine kinase n=1 Tax=Maritimibacter sp. DP1N21-5 TaxID=2836867 RepID=UPI001C43AB7F|nr:histidine kinase dimerization/phosphoacceptor domain -containing protein [Maritimibacter sp. DP1N21-5]MBV7409661.1 GAF domain-containing protein [Maritimibacter sp. DP1N21-5]
MTSTPPLPPEPTGNDHRLDKLEALCILDSDPEPGFDEITEFVARVCEVPTALVSLVDRDRQWFKARTGFDGSETSLDRSVCAYVVLEDDFLEIMDLSQDPRTRLNPLVTQKDGIRFYAGAPLRLSTGEVMGALCAIDVVPRQLTGMQRETLRVMARQVVAQMELKQAVQQAEMLKREVDHRVKNSLQSISALTRIQARKTKSDEVRAALTQVQSRIEMVAALHEQLYKTSASHEMNLGAFVEKVGVILGGTAPANVSIVTTCDRAMVTAEQASAVGVILNEFASNSIKHAYPEGRDGTIRFDGRLVDGDTFVLEMSDDGVGMGAVSHTTGIGLAVIEASVAQLGGAWEPVFGGIGTSARLHFPLKQTPASA